MRYFLRFFIAILFSITSTQAFSESKVVVLDLKYVLNNSTAGKDAQDFLKKTFNDNAKKFTEIEKSLKKDERALLEKKTTLTKEQYKEESNKLRKKVIKYQTDRRASIDKVGSLRAKARETLIKKLTPIVDSYIKENNISVVMDKKNMIGGLAEYDITQTIVEKLNKEITSLNLK
jgi:Skp family chaperone for outer membrane proteins